MKLNNIFKKSYLKDEFIDYKSSNDGNENENKLYIPPSKRIKNNNNLIQTIETSKINIFKNNTNSNSSESILKNKIKSKPLYRVTEEKLNSLDIFPELYNIKKNNDENLNKEKVWVIKDNDNIDKKNDEKEERDPTKLFVPDGWLLLSEVNKGKKLSEIEKERNERWNKQILDQYYANMQYLMKERNAIKRRLYISVGDYFGYDSVILRDMPLKLDFLNESDNELEEQNSDTDDEINIQSEYEDIDDRY